MPALVLLGRRFNVGADDLVWPFGWLAVLFTCRAVVFALLLAVFAPSFRACDRGAVYLGYLIAGLATSALSAIGAVAVARISLRGSILEPERRAGVVPWLYAHLALTVAEVTLAVAGMPLFLLQHDATCLAAAPQLVTAMTVVISVDLAAFVLFLIALVCTVAPVPASENHVESSFWLKIWGLLLFFSKSDELQALEQATAIVSDLLQFEDDLVPSDIMAGLVLLQQHQYHTNQLILPADQAPLSTDDFRLGERTTPDDARTAANFIRYAEAVYGWPLYLENNLCNACRLVPPGCAYLCASLATVDESGVVPVDEPRLALGLRVADDNCCGANATSAIAMARVGAREDIVYASFRNELFLSPFMICLDRGARAVVISVRGTLSIRDALVDAHIHPAALPSIPNGFAHSGFLRTAQNVRDAIEATGLLRRIFLDPAYADWTLVFVGHSLGAGTASLLAVLYREQYPNVRAWVFSPPGCVLNREAAIASEAFITSVVLHNDIVPRLGRAQLQRFKIDLVELMRACHRNKASVIARGVCWCYPAPEPFYDEELFVEAPLVVASDGPGRATSYSRLNDDELITPSAAGGVEVPQRPNSPPLHPTMFIPGRILHVVKFEDRRRRWGPVLYEMREATREDFHRLFISIDGFLTHLPDCVGAVLRHLAGRVAA